MIQERVLLIMNSYGMNPTEFADEIGVQRSSISHILSGRNNPSLDLITKILVRFPEVDSNWLVLGKGSLVMKTETKLGKDEKNESSETLDQEILNSPKDLFTDNQISISLEKEKEKVEELKQKIEDLEKKTPIIEETLINNDADEKLIDNFVSNKSIRKIIVYYSDMTYEELIKN